MSEESKNIYQRINAVREQVSYVQKEEKKIEGQYKAVSHDAVTAVLHDELVKNGIIIYPSLVKSQVISTGKSTSRGTPIIRYEATYAITFQNIDEKGDAFVLQVEAHADDTGDKAPGKAISYAVKYAKLKVFDLETGEDDEGRIESSPPKLTAETHQKLRDLCQELGMDAEKALESLAVNVYKVKTITDINEQWSADAEKRVRAKAAKDAENESAEE